MDQEIFHKFVRQTAHDVRTPITTIAGFANLLAEDKALPETLRDIAATIVAETRRLSDILESFFDEVSAGSETEG